MILNDETTWPVALVQYLEDHHDVLLNWELRTHTSDNSPESSVARAAASRYDNTINGLHAILNSYALRGYHCTRLTEPEIDYIVANGMQLQNRVLLCERIRAIQEAGLIESHVAAQLVQKNQGDEKNRVGMISFCFYAPYIAGQPGIERFFRSWGGEALYNSHERDLLTGTVLKSIGTPCLVEADVPIETFPRFTFLEKHLYQQFLVNRGLKTTECIHHEGYAIKPIPARSVRRLVRFPESDFIALTKCDAWAPPLI